MPTMAIRDAMGADSTRPALREGTAPLSKHELLLARRADDARSLQGDEVRPGDGGDRLAGQAKRVKVRGDRIRAELAQAGVAKDLFRGARSAAELDRLDRLRN